MEGALHTALQALLQSLAVALPLSARLRRTCTALTGWALRNAGYAVRSQGGLLFSFRS